MTFKVMIIDDEAAGIAALARQVEALESLTLVACVDDGHQAITEIERYRPDIVFMDIEMPECDGFRVAQATAHLPYHLVFVTAYHQHAIDAFTTQAIDYLLKPVRPERLRQCVDKISAARQSLLTHAAQIQPTILIDDGQQHHVIELAEIDYVESIGRYQRVCMASSSSSSIARQTLVTERTMEAFCTQLETANFMRIHRSYLVNLASIRILRRKQRNWVAVLRGIEVELPIARNRVAALKQALS